MNHGLVTGNELGTIGEVGLTGPEGGPKALDGPVVTPCEELMAAVTPISGGRGVEDPTPRGLAGTGWLLL